MDRARFTGAAFAGWWGKPRVYIQLSSCQVEWYEWLGMKGWRQRRGQAGEEIAVAFLQAQGYRIAARNFRIRQGEIDIIAWDDQTLVFVEVKTRAHTALGYPEEMVDRRKQQTLTRVAMAYLQRLQPAYQGLRFDVIAILVGSGVGPSAEPEINHIPAAFEPSSHYLY